MPSDAFNTAANEVKSLKTTPSDAQMLEVYALFKQATVGDVQGERPGMFDLKGKAKYDAWAAKKGTSTDAAEKEYIALVESLKASHGI
ncbi:diazepam binding inhibitor-like protein [Blastocladiella britannica]|nr:diazepam binding inhibitor-like protein [Blastocladiella britannica]